jgi:hypothetical protein
MWTRTSSLFLALALTVAFATPVEAQFVCGGSANGGEPQTGSGAATLGTGSRTCGSGAGLNFDPNATGQTFIGNDAGSFTFPGGTGGATTLPSAAWLVLM